MDMEEALKKICERVLMFEMDESKNGGSPKAVVCISGSTFGYEKAMAELVRLKEAGWRFDVFMSDTGMLLHDPAKVREQLEPEHIYSRQNCPMVQQLYKEADCIIIAATTANAATKIAYGIIDTPMLVVINHSLMAGKPVICSSNGANPDDPERAQAGMRFSPEGYREMMLEHLQKMEKLGITVTDAESLCRVCSEKVKA